MTTFGDVQAASRMRDTIERITTGIIDKIRPKPFLARVYDLNINTQKARVVRAGETTANLTTVQFALDKIPQIAMVDKYSTLGENAPGDIVRVAGEPGAYYLMDFFSGSPLVLQQSIGDALHANPSFEDPTFANGVPVGWMYQTYLYSGGWSMSLDDTDRVHGNFSLKINHPSGSLTRLHNTDAFSVLPGDTIRISNWSKSSAAGSVVYLLLYTGATAGAAQLFGGGTSQQKMLFMQTFWAKQQADFVVPAGHTFARIEIQPATLLSVDFTYWIDDTRTQRFAFVPWIAVDGSTPGSTNLFTNSWINFGSTHQSAQFRKIDDVVEMRGLIKSGTINTAAFTLPVGYRPPADVVFASIEGANSIGRLDVRSDGSVVPTSGATGYFSLNHRFSTI